MSDEHHNSRWKRVSERVRRTSPLCQDPFGWHKLSGVFSPAVCVHHINPVDKRPDLMFDSENLLSLCQTCHDAIHGQPEALLAVLHAGVAPTQAAAVIGGGGVPKTQNPDDDRAG